jgi:pimeloyl-ACP methyl ester carboxylesterase
MVAWMKETWAMPHEDMAIQSADGLTLRGKYYECIPGGPIELMFHGYRGNADRDLCGGVQRCFALQRNTLIVDQRACGTSDGNIITFGIKESDDCHRWIAYLIQRFGPDVKIIITGISMGASTVMLAAGRELPEQVVGVLADCGFTSAKDIIQEVIRQMKLPPKLAYPFVKLGAKLFGHFDLDKDSSLEAMKRCKVPVMFIHGEDDDFVPCEMSRRNYAACAAQKKLWTVPGAGHGLSILVDKPGYMRELREFFDPLLSERSTL